MILQDIKGDRIHASIPNPILKKWLGNIREFCMYVMSNFIVVDNKIKSRTIPELLNAEKLDNTELFDMIAEVVGKEDPRELVTSKGKETRRLAVVLEDLEGNKIGCTLFRETVDHLLPHLEDVREEPLIVVLQYFEASRWNGKTSVQSNFSISKVHVDLELEEVLGFKNRLLNIAPATTSRISQVTTQGAWSATDELNNGVIVVKTVEQTLNSKEEGTCWIVGTIVAINVGKNDWFYKSYRKCSKKVETPIGDRFKVEVMVYDGTRSISLLLWDRETTQLCGKKADQVREEEDTGEGEYPSSLDNMMDKKDLFKINIKSGNIKHFDQVYPVIKICDDEHLIDKYLQKEEHSNVSANPSEMGCSNSIDISENIINIKTNSDNQFNMDPMEAFVSSLKSKTPVKGTSNDMKCGFSSTNINDEEGQFSTNKFTRKTNKRQKI
ncbi:uncharacterized protein LOC130956718 [Arachis stenosperma]|uniref:uncharacterized protein LOC130956718 n=1 Tax=Arachis stenosperma TaxID=217475 RepID=UPI0025AB6464|nr:uncharacterized protein LOC130956718 [Arachis stenosperma]